MKVSHRIVTINQASGQSLFHNDEYYDSEAEAQKVLKEHIGWDSRQASINWSENSKRLCDNWGGQAINLVKYLDSYDEALRRMKNKTTK